MPKLRLPNSVLIRVFAYTTILFIFQALFFFTWTLIEKLPNQYTGLIADIDIYHDAYKGPIKLIHNNLTGDFQADQAKLKSLSVDFGYPLQLIPNNNFIKEQLNKTKIWVDINDYQYYSAYQYDNRYVLVVGPVVNKVATDKNDSIFEFYVLVYLSLSIIFTIALFFMALSPLGKDAFALRKFSEDIIANKISQHNLNTRSWLFRPLSLAFEQMMKQINRLLSNSKVLSLAMAHELRTPLARMKFSLAIIENSDDKTLWQAEAKHITQDIQDLEALINISLDFFKFQQHDLKVHIEAVPIQTVLDDIGQSFALIKPENIQLSVQSEAYLLPTDVKLLKIAIGNLLQNAMKYAQNTVSLSGFVHGNDYVITVSDDGIGIDPKQHEHVFTPFIQLNKNQQNSQHKGYGLGLAYVKLIMDYLGGRVLIQNQQPQGAVLCLHLPLSTRSNDTK